MAEITGDELIVEQFSSDAKTAFAAVIEQYSTDVAALANRLLGWPGEVEDVAQEVFLAAYMGLRKFRGQSSIKTWLFSITINKCRTYRYKRMLRLRPQKLKVDKSAAPAHSRLENAEDFSKVRNSIATLPDKLREPVVLRYLQELEMEEISNILDISKNALQVRLSRARERLKKDLAELMEI